LGEGRCALPQNFNGLYLFPCGKTVTSVGIGNSDAERFGHAYPSTTQFEMISAVGVIFGALARRCMVE